MHSSTTLPSEVDASTLALPIPADDLRQFRSRMSALPGYGGLARATGSLAVAIIVYSLLGLTIEFVVIGIPVTVLIGVGSLLPGLLVLVLGAPALGWALWRWINPKIRDEYRARGGWPRRFRLDRLARANGWYYTPEVPDTPRFASVFTSGDSRYGWDRFSGPRLEIGNYRTSDQHNQGIAPRGWGYLRIQLPQNVPHLLLLPKKTRIYPARLIVPVNNDQILHLEGDFDDHFTLYVPTGYERDALYVITPDLMAVLIDEVPGSFVEMLGAHLTIAFPGPIDAADPRDWARVSRILATVGRKSLRQTTRYADERSPVRGSVGVGGQRLRRGIPIALVISAVWILFQILSHLIRFH